MRRRTRRSLREGLRCDLAQAAVTRKKVKTMVARTSADFDPSDFSRRPIGPSPEDVGEMLSTIGVSDLGELISQTVPEAIRQAAPLALPAGISETEALQKLRIIADKNKIFTSLIGQGYHGTSMPPVLHRNVLECPAEC